MKKIIFTSICSAFFGLICFAQGATSIDVATEKLYMSSEVSKPVEALGSPYVNKKFSPVKVEGFDDQVFTGRFNAYNGEMEINLGTKIIALDNSKDYSVVYTQDNKVYKIFNYSTAQGESKRGFLNIVSQKPDYSLLKEEIIKYQDKVKAATSYQSDKPAKFIKGSAVYYIKKTNVIRAFPTRKKDLLKAYAKDAKEVKSFLKKEKISFKKEKDLIKLAGFLSAL